MKEISLNGKWQLYYFEQGKKDITHPDGLNGLSPIPCSVPGNVEHDLSATGVLPADLYYGEAIREAEKYEDYEWWYKTEFSCDTAYKNGQVSLHFEGVDTLAQYWLNGKYLGESDNMFVPVDFDVTGLLCDKNTLTVRLRSVCLECYHCEYQPFELRNAWSFHSPESHHIRKAPHMYGWDIFPRAVSAGLWRDVSLILHDRVEITDLGYHILNFSQDEVLMRFHFDTTLTRADIRKNTMLTISGKCGNRTFHTEKKLYFRAGYIDATIQTPALWWPAGYGEANLYDTVVALTCNGETLAQKNLQVGVRNIQLRHTDTTDGENGDFRFIVNNTDIMCKGTNWVPLDAYHSKEHERYAPALELLSDIGCNMVRCWGGNVYPEDCFYDYCDRHGIMVWQDFSMACHAYPQDDTFAEVLRKEAEAIVCRYKTHPSLVVWSGDNECDYMYYEFHTDPNTNRLTREILPQTVSRFDGSRPYIASSPYFGKGMLEIKERSGENEFGALPEAHLWGPRDYFKSEYYATSKAHFVSETGYFGCPDVAELKKFIQPDHLWPNDGDPQWVLHSSDFQGDDYRIKQLNKQVYQLFGEIPEQIEDFVLASQISQAEAMKYFIERIRCGRPQKTGIIWWNLMDGWPQISDAVVGYYYDKKLAYHYIKECQQHFALMCSEIHDWCIDLIAANDTLIPQKGSYRVWDIDTDETLVQGEFEVGINQNKILAKFPVYYSDHRWLVIEWMVNGKTAYNHFVCGFPAFDFKRYTTWLEKAKKYISK